MTILIAITGGSGSGKSTLAETLVSSLPHGAAALMLTGETAVGRYPVQAMEYLVRTAGRAMADFSEED